MRERERECTRARARGEETFQSVRRSPANSELQSAPISRAPVRRPQSEIAIDASQDRAIDRDLAKIEIVPSIAILISRDRDRRRDLAKRQTQSRRREIAPDQDRNQRRDLAKRRSRDLVCRRERKIRDRDRRFARSRCRSRSRLREIAIDGAISRNVDREISYVGERGRSEIAIDAS